MKHSAMLTSSLAVLVIALTACITHAVGELLQAGATAPNFTLSSQVGTPITLSGYKGKWVVLYFYAKDKSKGCTIEARNFQRNLEKFKALHAVVLGVSLDTSDSHKSFAAQERLTFRLLADPDHKVADAYGIPIHPMGESKFAERKTYLIDPSGHIAKVWERIDPNTHSDEVLAALITAEKK